VARILGSRDGGRTFPYVVWHRVQESSAILEEGQITTDALDWAAGSDRVAFRFETGTGWYWRVGEIQVYGDALSEVTPVSHLTILPKNGGVTLFWRSTDKALSYQVFTASADGEEQFRLYKELQDTTFVDMESYNMDRRFYRVFALMREGKLHSETNIQSNVEAASLGAPDIRWNVRNNRANR